MIEAVIFDWFGVCAEKWIDVWQRGLASEVDPEELRRTFFQHLDAYAVSEISGEEFLVKVIGSQDLEPSQHKNLLTETGEINFELLQNIRLMKQRYRTALLSDNFTDIAPVIDRKIGGFSQYFDIVVLSNELKIGKKSPEIYQAALDQLAVPAEHTGFIDDKQTNLNVASHLGIETILYQSNEQLYQALRTRGIEI